MPFSIPRLPAALTLLLIFVAAPRPAATQETFPRASDVASVDAIVEAAYDALARAPGAPFQWNRLRSLFLPGARLIPNVAQTGGELQPQTVEQFIAIVQAAWEENIGIGSPNDKGFEERQVAARTEQYGSVAHVFSTYEKHFWQDPAVIGRGINSFQLLRHNGRWWITGIIWDEEPAAGPVPDRYRGSGGDGSGARDE